MVQYAVNSVKPFGSTSTVASSDNIHQLPLLIYLSSPNPALFCSILSLLLHNFRNHLIDGFLDYKVYIFIILKLISDDNSNLCDLNLSIPSSNDQPLDPLQINVFATPSILASAHHRIPRLYFHHNQFLCLSLCKKNCFPELKHQKVPLSPSPKAINVKLKKYFCLKILFRNYLDLKVFYNNLVTKYILYPSLCVPSLQEQTCRKSLHRLINKLNAHMPLIFFANYSKNTVNQEALWSALVCFYHCS